MDGIEPVLSHTIWLKLPLTIRTDLARIFNLQRTGESVVHVGAIIDNNISGELTSDGYTAQDLQGITVDKLQEFTGVRSTDFYHLFSAAIDILNGASTLPEQLGHKLEEEAVAPKNKGGRPKKHDKEN